MIQEFDQWCHQYHILTRYACRNHQDLEFMIAVIYQMKLQIKPGHTVTRSSCPITCYHRTFVRPRSGCDVSHNQEKVVTGVLRACACG